MSNETSFFKFIFNDDTKFAIINHAQISFISFIPFYLLAMILDALPEASIKKGILELVFEIFLHVLILIIGIVIIVKFSVYFKPLSGVPYPEGFSFAPFILACLFIGITYQSKLSEKISAVKEKIFNKMTPEKKTQPTQSQSHSLIQPVQTPPQNQPQTQNTQAQSLQLPNYNQMYQNQNIENFEPSAANEMYSGIGTNF
jgi:general stress protein CsbA